MGHHGGHQGLPWEATLGPPWGAPCLGCPARTSWRGRAHRKVRLPSCRPSCFGRPRKARPNKRSPRSRKRKSSVRVAKRPSLSTRTPPRPILGPHSRTLKPSPTSPSGRMPSASLIWFRPSPGSRCNRRKEGPTIPKQKHLALRERRRRASRTLPAPLQEGKTIQLVRVEPRKTTHHCPSKPLTFRRILNSRP